MYTKLKSTWVLFAIQKFAINCHCVWLDSYILVVKNESSLSLYRIKSDKTKFYELNNEHYGMLTKQEFAVKAIVLSTVRLTVMPFLSSRGKTGC